MDIIRSGSKPTNKAPASYFTGDVWSDAIIEAPDPARVRALRVTFSPGARTAWHTHPLGQTIHIIHGTGRVQRAGGPVEEVKAGDTVFFAPNERHWHGAAPNNMMVHIAIQEALNGSHVAWEQHVTDAEYNKTAG
ncbi:MAG: cupin domain-containing protein [Pseudorhodoplanes sp.]